MKKLVLIVAATLAVVSFSACKKTCTCTSYADGVKGASVTSEVKGKCADLNTTSELGGVKMEVKCE